MLQLAGLHWNPKRVLFFGRSIGTGPAVKLASELECGGSYTVLFLLFFWSPKQVLFSERSIGTSPAVNLASELNCGSLYSVCF